MSEVETEERVFRVPLQFIKPLPFNTTVIGTKEEEMLYEEMKRPDGPEKIDPIILRRLTPEEIEECKDEYPWAKYEIVDGHTRFKIASALHWPWIRARILDISREQAYEANYRKNKERGQVSQLAEALYFKYLQVDLKMTPYEIGKKFGYSEKEVNEILARVVLPKDARGYITSKLSEVGKLLSSKHLKVIASAPPERQRAVAEAIVEGRLKADEAERAKEAIVQGLTKEEAIKIARSKDVAPKVAEEVVVPAPTAAPSVVTPPAVALPAETTLEEEIVCPKCGAKAHVDWASKRIEWLEG
ncbi:MAG: hypothetical protein QXH00_06420 [Candidatus Jordarchaeales archaeon]